MSSSYRIKVKPPVGSTSDEPVIIEDFVRSSPVDDVQARVRGRILFFLVIGLMVVGALVVRSLCK